jgi:alpha-1,3/alpha-1,6-mannosyltransferase
MNVAILHPELGIGGAERLIVNAALALQARGHRVTLFTANHDRAHCFAETRDGTLDVRVHGSRLPMRVRDRMRLPLAIARMLALSRPAVRRAREFDVILCDVVAQIVPLLRWRTRTPIVFYCHFPDLLLTPPRHGWYRWYRVLLDRWEEAGMGAADRVLVNSAYTGTMLGESLPGLRAAVQVLHPGVELDRHAGPDAPPPSASQTIVAVSRFAPNKNLELALDAYAQLRARLPAARFAATRLVIAGACDMRLGESRDTFAALRRRGDDLGLGAQVTLQRSPGDGELRAVLERARCVVFTPPCEHFGIVPIEAMAARRPVVAVDGGGPRETVVDGETGLLCPPTAGAFAAAMQRLLDEPDTADRLGRAGRARAEREFSLPVFGARLDAVLRSLVAG